MELEAERGNELPNVTGLNQDLPAKWIAESRRIAYGYAVLAKDTERVWYGRLTKREKREMENTVCEIPLLDSDIVLKDDGDGGYLVVRAARAGRPARSRADK